MHMLWRQIAELEQIKEPLLFSDSIKFTGCSSECEPEPLVLSSVEYKRSGKSDRECTLIQHTKHHNSFS